MIRVPLIIAVSFVLFICPIASFPAVTSGADFLKIPKSARATALAESYTAMIDDPTAIDYNPAALNTMRNMAVSLMYQSWIDNSYGIYSALGYRFHDLVIGGSFYFFNYGGLTVYDYFGSEEAAYNPFDMNIKVAASLDGGFLWDKLRGFSVGATISAINRNMIDESRWGFTFDAGINYKTVLGKLIKADDEAVKDYFDHLPIDAGFVIQNIGYAVDTVTPVRFSGGLAVTVVPDLIISMDLTKDVYNTPWMFKMGAEYTLFEILSLRAGFNLGRDTGNVAMGLGLRYPMHFNNLRFDYAFTPLGVLGNNHNFSLYGEFIFDVNAKDYRDKGRNYFYKKDYLKAREMWEKAFQMEPENSDIKEELLMVNRIITVMELDTNRVVSSNQASADANPDMAFEGPGVVVNGTNVTFYYRFRSGKVHSVAVTGDFIGWLETGLSMNEGTNGWFISFDLKPGVYQYKYIVNRTKWIFDPSNPQIMPDGKGGLSSVFEIKEPLPVLVETNIEMTNETAQTSSQSESSSEGQTNAGVSTAESSSSSSVPTADNTATNAPVKVTNMVINIPMIITNVVKETNLVDVDEGHVQTGRTNRMMVITARTNVIQTNRTFYYKPQAFKSYYGKKFGSKSLRDLLVNNLRSYYFYNSYGLDSSGMTFPLYGDTMFDLHPDKYIKKKKTKEKNAVEQKKKEKKAVPVKKAVKKKPPVKKVTTISNWINTDNVKPEIFEPRPVKPITNKVPPVTNIRRNVSPVIETYQ